MQATLVLPNYREMCRQAAYHVSELLHEKHIYDALPDEYKTLWYAHELLSEIEDGDRITILVWDGNLCLGCGHGVLDDNGVYTCHIMFLRNVNAVKACLLCEEELKKYCREYNLKLEIIRGNIAQDNRAALRCARLFGSENKGVNVNNMMWKNGKLTPTCTMEKKVDL